MHADDVPGAVPQPPDWQALGAFAVARARLLVDNVEVAREIAQDKMAELIIRSAAGILPANPEAWLTTVLANASKNERRRRHREQRGLARLAGRRVSRPNDEAADRAIARRLVEDYLAGLPPRQRAALELRYGADLGTACVADAMGVSFETAREHLKRGLRSTRKRHSGGDPEGDC